MMIETRSTQSRTTVPIVSNRICISCNSEYQVHQVFFFTKNQWDAGPHSTTFDLADRHHRNLGKKKVRTENMIVYPQAESLPKVLSEPQTG